MLPYLCETSSLLPQGGAADHSNGLSLVLLGHCLGVANFRERRLEAVQLRRITLLGTSVNNVGCPELERGRGDAGENRSFGVLVPGLEQLRSRAALRGRRCGVCGVGHRVCSRSGLPLVPSWKLILLRITPSRRTSEN